MLGRIYVFVFFFFLNSQKKKKNASSFHIIRLPRGKKPPVSLSVGATETQTVNKEADRGSEENSIYHPLRHCRNAAI